MASLNLYPGPQATAASAATLLFRSPWPYRLGMVGGYLAGFAFVCLLLAATIAPSLSLLLIAIGMLVSGCTCMSAAWFPLVKDGHPGAGPGLGSLAIPLAVIYASVHPGQVGGLVLMGSYLVFALGHLAVAGPTRVLALFAATPIAIGFVVSPELAMMTILMSYLALACLCFCVALTMPVLRHQRS